MEIDKIITFEKYISSFYDKHNDKYLSKGTCLYRDISEIKERYNSFIKRIKLYKN